MKKGRLFVGYGRRCLACILVLGICLGSLSGCVMPLQGDKTPQGKPSQKEPLSITGFAFDTTYTLTLYEGGDQALLDSCVAKCNDYEKIFSRTRKDSELYQVNALEQCYLRAWQQTEDGGDFEINNMGKPAKRRLACLQNALEQQKAKEGLEQKETRITAQGCLQVAVSDELSALLSEGARYAALSGGGFDFTIGTVSRLWDFSSQDNSPPSADAIEQALPYVDYHRVAVRDGVAEFAVPGIEIDLGGIAKGYIADGLKKYLEDNGAVSGVISLGGNILCVGEKPDGTPFRIGIQQPFADRETTVGAVSVRDRSVVSSGIYERYLKTDEGKLYHHILNPKTGYSYENNLAGVTIVSDQSVDGDGLSTVCFALGSERGLVMVDSLDGIEAVFLMEDGSMRYSKGFEELMDD